MIDLICKKGIYMSNNDQNMNVTLQGKLVIGFIKLFKKFIIIYITPLKKGY